MHILLVSDAWHPQINGVVRTLDTTRAIVEEKGHTFSRITPDQFRINMRTSSPPLPCIKPLIKIHFSYQLGRQSHILHHILGLTCPCWCLRLSRRLTPQRVPPTILGD